MKQEIAVREVVLDLHELADAANKEHRQTEQSLRDCVSHAIRCGEFLEIAHGQVPRGDWLKWLEKNFEGSVVLASVYRRFAAGKDILEAAQPDGIVSARELLAGVFRMPVKSEFSRFAPEMEAMRSTGASLPQIAEVYGCSPTTVSCLINPEYRRRVQKRLKARGLERAAADRALRRERAAVSVARTKDDLGEAYSLLRKVAPLLDRSRIQHRGQTGKSLEVALADVYSVMDRIMAVVGEDHGKDGWAAA